jgi:MFS family permease
VTAVDQPAAPSRRSIRTGETFAALASRNFRLYLAGQTVSQAGTWMQVIGQAWLVLQLTDSGTALGIVAALQALPVLFFAPFGGVVVDRVDKRRLLVATQVAAGVLAGVLWLITATGVVELWMVYVLALAFGAVLVFDNPVRQTIVVEMVGPDLLTNAISLNSVNFNAGRIVGPAIAGALIVTIGISPCFLINALSYVAVVVALLLIRRNEMVAAALQTRAKRQLRDGLSYVRRTPELFIPVLMMILIGTLTYETQVTLPLFAKRSFDGDAGTYSAMTVAMGVGAVIGGLAVAARLRPTRRNFLVVTLWLGASFVLCAASPSLLTALVMMGVVGAASVTFLAVANSTLQLSTIPMMRGRVMSLWSVAFLGSAPVGGPAVGAVGEYFGARWGVFIGGAAPLLAAVLAFPALRRLPGGLAAVANPGPEPPAPVRGG